jgi:hypothetical protein
MVNLFSWTMRRGTVLTEEQRITAHYVIGEPGVGKSRLCWLPALIRG